MKNSHTSQCLKQKAQRVRDGEASSDDIAAVGVQMVLRRQAAICVVVQILWATLRYQDQPKLWFCLGYKCSKLGQLGTFY